MSEAIEQCEKCGSTAIARLPGGGKSASYGSGRRCSMCGHQWQGAAKTPSARPAQATEPKEAA
jgi:ribosomal protein L37AE/L43A